ncbi:DUF2971 domain-containing protein [Bradyrhizobium manausense]|uniref:DUF2971 domain-containing protein n=1 Tax=Bradyrhizobium manausense TaxID=989370 RepID=UPI001BAA4CBE|nr:DUF2971 domain-containing protein [Bradyrhizobium manausense]MBR0727035.1 DUF2971 domain-containing protein [Bradyrhizobium manausense]
MSETDPPDYSRVPLPPQLQQAIETFKGWTSQHLLSEQNNSTITQTLYHYTDVRGLKGILEAGQIWFTDYRHLNDPSELTHGIDMARDVAHHIATGADGRVRLFLDYFLDLFRHDNFAPSLEFFIACFSRARDDLGQWRAYADNGRGVAIGLSPSLFAVADAPPPGQLPEFVGPVRYSLADVCGRHEACLEEAAAIFLASADANADLLADKSIGIPFMDQFVREIIASPLIWNCLTSKHPAYEHEQEVRLVMMGTPATVSPFVTTRFRGSEIVPYIAQPMPLRVQHKIAEIVVGPAAPPDTERTVRTMLRSIGIDWSFPISRSDIPYRAS